MDPLVFRVVEGVDPAELGAAPMKASLPVLSSRRRQRCLMCEQIISNNLSRLLFRLSHSVCPLICPPGAVDLAVGGSASTDW